MKISIAGIHRSTLLLELYNHALCQGTEFDDSPALKSTALMLGELKGNIVATEALFDSGQTDFNYIDLGAGRRPIKIRWGTRIDFTQYDKYHGDNRGQSIVKAIRKKVLSETTGEDELSSLLRAISSMHLENPLAFSYRIEPLKVKAEEKPIPPKR